MGTGLPDPEKLGPGRQAGDDGGRPRDGSANAILGPFPATTKATNTALECLPDERPASSAKRRARHPPQRRDRARAVRPQPDFLRSLDPLRLERGLLCSRLFGCRALLRPERLPDRENSARGRPAGRVLAVPPPLLRAPLAPDPSALLPGAPLAGGHWPQLQLEQPRVSPELQPEGPRVLPRLVEPLDRRVVLFPHAARPALCGASRTREAPGSLLRGLPRDHHHVAAHSRRLRRPRRPDVGLRHPQETSAAHGQPDGRRRAGRRLDPPAEGLGVPGQLEAGSLSALGDGPPLCGRLPDLDALPRRRRGLLRLCPDDALPARVAPGGRAPRRTGGERDDQRHRGPAEVDTRLSLLVRDELCRVPAPPRDFRSPRPARRRGRERVGDRSRRPGGARADASSLGGHVPLVREAHPALARPRDAPGRPSPAARRSRRLARRPTRSDSRDPRPSSSDNPSARAVSRARGPRTGTSKSAR